MTRTNAYIIPNVISPEKTEVKARKDAAEGRGTHVHYHRVNEPCNDNCHKVVPDGQV